VFLDAPVIRMLMASAWQRYSFDRMRLFHLGKELTSAAWGAQRPFPAVFGVLTGWAASGG
jgi:hypothetical protein